MNHGLYAHCKLSADHKQFTIHCFRTCNINLVLKKIYFELKIKNNANSRIIRKSNNELSQSTHSTATQLIATQPTATQSMKAPPLLNKLGITEILLNPIETKETLNKLSKHSQTQSISTVQSMHPLPGVTTQNNESPQSKSSKLITNQQQTQSNNTTTSPTNDLNQTQSPTNKIIHVKSNVHIKQPTKTPQKQIQSHTSKSSIIEQNIIDSVQPIKPTQLIPANSSVLDTEIIEIKKNTPQKQTKQLKPKLSPPKQNLYKEKSQNICAIQRKQSQPLPTQQIASLQSLPDISSGRIKDRIITLQQPPTQQKQLPQLKLKNNENKFKIKSKKKKKKIKIKNYKRNKKKKTNQQQKKKNISVKNIISNINKQQTLPNNTTALQIKPIDPIQTPPTHNEQAQIPAIDPIQTTTTLPIKLTELPILNNNKKQLIRIKNDENENKNKLNLLKNDDIQTYIINHKFTNDQFDDWIDYKQNIKQNITAKQFYELTNGMITDTLIKEWLDSNHSTSSNI